MLDQKLVKSIVEPELEIVSQIISPEDAELMIDPKRSCKHCYGRGYQLWLEGDGYTVNADGERVKSLKRISRPCACVFRGAKFRLKK